MGHVANDELPNELTAARVGDLGDLDVQDAAVEPASRCRVAAPPVRVASCSVVVELQEAVDRRRDEVGAIACAPASAIAAGLAERIRVSAHMSTASGDELDEAAIAFVARALFLERALDVRRHAVGQLAQLVTVDFEALVRLVDDARTGAGC